MDVKQMPLYTRQWLISSPPEVLHYFPDEETEAHREIKWTRKKGFIYRGKRETFPPLPPKNKIKNKNQL